MYRERSGCGGLIRICQIAAALGIVREAANGISILSYLGDREPNGLGRTGVGCDRQDVGPVVARNLGGSNSRRLEIAKGDTAIHIRDFRVAVEHDRHGSWRIVGGCGRVVIRDGADQTAVRKALGCQGRTTGWIIDIVHIRTVEGLCSNRGHIGTNVDITDRERKLAVATVRATERIGRDAGNRGADNNVEIRGTAEHIVGHLSLSLVVRDLAISQI